MDFVLYVVISEHFNLNRYRKGIMNITPKISVVFPLCKTSLPLVKEAIDSVLQQTFRDFELLIVCNGVDSNFLSEIQRLTKLDNRVRILELPVADLVKALNFGVQEAKGKYIARQDGDDISCLNRFAVQWDYMEMHPELAFSSSFALLLNIQGDIIEHQKRPVGVENIANFLAYKDSCVVHGGAILRADVIKQHLYSLESYAAFAEDYDLWLRLMFEHNQLGDNIPEYLYKYRVNPRSSTWISANRITQRNNVKLLKQKYRALALQWFARRKEYKYQNRTFNENDLPWLHCVSILKQLWNKCEEENIPYNIDGLDNKSHTWKPRFWEYSFAYKSTRPKGTVLDAGSGFSLFPAMLAKKGLKVYSIDLSFQDKRASQAARLGLDIQADQGSFFSLPYTNEFFDVVYCISCLEHIKDYKNVALALKEFRRVLKPGGKLFVTVDYHKGFIDFGQAGWKWSEHTRYYNWHMILEKIVKPSGMKLIDSRELVDSTDWSRPPLYNHYTFAAFTLVKEG